MARKKSSQQTQRSGWMSGDQFRQQQNKQNRANEGFYTYDDFVKKQEAEAQDRERRARINEILMRRQSEEKTKQWKKATQEATYSRDKNGNLVDNSWQVYATKQMLDTPGAYEREQERYRRQNEQKTKAWKDAVQDATYSRDRNGNLVDNSWQVYATKQMMDTPGAYEKELERKRKALMDSLQNAADQASYAGVKKDREANKSGYNYTVDQFMNTQADVKENQRNGLYDAGTDPWLMSPAALKAYNASNDAQAKGLRAQAQGIRDAYYSTDSRPTQELDSLMSFMDNYDWKHAETVKEKTDAESQLADIRGSKKERTQKAMSAAERVLESNWKINSYFGMLDSDEERRAELFDEIMPEEYDARVSRLTDEQKAWLDGQIDAVMGNMASDNYDKEQAIKDWAQIIDRLEAWDDISLQNTIKTAGVDAPAASQQKTFDERRNYVNQYADLTFGNKWDAGDLAAFNSMTPEEKRVQMYNMLMPDTYEDRTAGMEEEEKAQLDVLLDQLVQKASGSMMSEEQLYNANTLDREASAYESMAKKGQTVQDYLDDMSFYSSQAAGIKGDGEYDPSLAPEVKWYYTEDGRMDKEPEPQGTETDKAYFWMNNWRTLGEAANSPDYANKYFFVDDDQRDQFNKFYKYDKKNGTHYAENFLQGMDNYLQTMLSKYQDYYFRSKAEEPGTNIIMRLLSPALSAVGGTLGTIGTALAPFGVAGADDPNSKWYLTSKAVTSGRSQQNENMSDLAAQLFGEKARPVSNFLLNVVDSMADNIFAMGVGKMVAGAEDYKRAMRVVQWIMSSEATSNTMIRQLENGRDGTEAALYAIGDGTIEWVTERVSLEALLSPDMKEVLRDWKSLAKFLGKVSVAEGSEEINADLLNIGLDWLLSMFNGHETELKERYNELVANGEMSDRDASRQVLLEKMNEIGMSGLAGALSGLGLGLGRVATNAYSQYRSGENILNNGNAMKKILKLGLEMKEGTDSRNFAEEINKKINNGEKPGKTELGKLAQLMTLDTGEEQSQVIKDTIRNDVQAALEEKGIEKGKAKAYAETIAKNLFEGTRLSAKDRGILAEDERAIDVWREYNKPLSVMGIQTKINISENTEKQRSLINTIGEMTSRTLSGAGPLGADIDRSIRETHSVQEAIDNLQERLPNILSKRMAAKAKDIYQNQTDAQESKNYLNDVMKLVLAAKTLTKSIPQTWLDASTAQQIYDEAKAEFDEQDQERLTAQVKAEPGKGVAVYDGAEYGTESWKEKIKSLPKALRNQMGALGEVAVRMGMRMRFINDEKNPGVWGYEQRNGEITINLAARYKKGFSHNMLVTMAHEMTHWLEQNSWEEYNKLRQYVLDGLRAKGENIEQNIIDTINNQSAVLADEKADILDVNGALADIVARSCENLLSSKAMADELAKTDPSLFNKIRTYVKNFTARLNEALNSMPMDISREARMLKEYTEEIAQIWLGARQEALTREPGEVTEEAEGVNFSVEQAEQASMKELNDTYMKAVETGDTQTQARTVAEAARRAGYTEQVFHGTTSFGFTKFDLNRSKGAIFAAYDEKLARTYTRDGYLRRISERAVGDLSKMTNDQLLKEVRRVITHTGPDAIENWTLKPNGKYQMTYHDSWNNNKQVQLEYDRRSVEQQIVYTLKNQNQLVIDAKKASAGRIWVQQANRYMTTRDIAAWAKEQGYDSVRINNVENTGSKNINQLLRKDVSTKYKDIAVFYNAENVKSADPVVYDDNGKVIPLSERFNAGETDIRYSVEQASQRVTRLQNINNTVLQTINALNSKGPFTTAQIRNALKGIMPHSFEQWLHNKYGNKGGAIVQLSDIIDFINEDNQEIQKGAKSIERGWTKLQNKTIKAEDITSTKIVDDNVNKKQRRLQKELFGNKNRIFVNNKSTSSSIRVDSTLIEETFANNNINPNAIEKVLKNVRTLLADAEYIGSHQDYLHKGANVHYYVVPIDLNNSARAVMFAVHEATDKQQSFRKKAYVAQIKLVQKNGTTLASWRHLSAAGFTSGVVPEVSIGDVIDVVNDDRFRNYNPEALKDKNLRFSVEQMLDDEYAEAVENKNWTKAEQMLMDKYQQMEEKGLIGYRAVHFNNGTYADIAQKIKSGDPEIIRKAAEDMAPKVPENAVLIPMPPHDGQVTENTDTMLLAKAISEITGSPVINALGSEEHISRKVAKETGNRDVNAEAMGFRQIAEVPENAMPVFIDNMVAGAVTAKAAHDALGRGITLAYAQSARAKIKGAKYLSVTYDTEKNLIPLSERMNPDNKSWKYSVEQLDNDLIAYHNITEDQLMKVLQLGGFAVPSIAITRTNYANDRYGEISVVFNPGTIDPGKSKLNKVYSGDAWTPVYPSVEYKLNEKKVNGIIKIINQLVPQNMRRNSADLYVDNLQKRVNSSRGDVVNAVKNMDLLQLAYVMDKGIGLKTPTREKTLDGFGKFKNDQVLYVLNELGENVVRNAYEQGFRYIVNNQELIEKVRKALNDQFREKHKDVSLKIAKMDLYSADKFQENYAYNIIEAANKYLDNGIEQELDEYALRDAVKEKIDEADYENWLADLFDGVIEKKGIRNNKDYYTYNGNARSWEALHDEETLDNVVKIMRSQEEKGGNAIFNQSAMLAVGTRNFKSLNEIRQHKEQLQHMTDEEMSAAKSEIVNNFSQLMDELFDRKESNIFIARDRVLQAMVDAVRTKRTVSGITSVMKEWGYNITQEQAQQIADNMEKIANLPTEYFEAKPQRGVTFDEIEKVLLPETAGQALKDALDERGIPYETYDGTNEGRLAALNRQTGAMFSVEQSPDAEVNNFMMGLSELSLGTVQERTMLKQYKELHQTVGILEMKIRDWESRIRKLKAKEKLSAFDRREISKYSDYLNNDRNRLEKLHRELVKVTGTRGYARIMMQQDNLMKNLLSGRTAGELNETINAILNELENVNREMAERAARLKELEKKNAVLRIRQQFNLAGLKKIASKLKSDMNSTLENSEIENRLALIALKMKQGSFDQENTAELADLLIGRMRNSYDSYVLSELRGSTITLSKSQLAELKATNRTLRDIQAELAGTGIRVTGKGGTTLDAKWSELCDLIPSLDPNASDKQMLDDLMGVIRSEKRATDTQTYSDENLMATTEMILKAAQQLLPEIVTDEKSLKLIRETLQFVQDVSKQAGESAEAMEDIGKMIDRLKKSGAQAQKQANTLTGDIGETIEYFNTLAEQSEAAMWKKERLALIDQLKSETTQKVMEEQEKWKQKIEKDKAAREKMETNLQLRKRITTNVTRMRKLLINETDIRNIPEHMKGLAREMLRLIVENDMARRKITGIDAKDLADTKRVLDIMEARDGVFTENDLRLIHDEEAQAAVLEALAELEDGIGFYNNRASGDILTNLQAFRNALEKISDAVSTITSVINAERSISFMDRRMDLADAAEDVRRDFGKSKIKQELIGRGSKAINSTKAMLFWGNLTPVYYFKMLRNAGMDMQWGEMQRGENRSGLETQKARAYLFNLAEKTGFADWANEKHEVTLGGQKRTITIQNMMELYAIWKREQTINPEMSQHLSKGGVFIQDDTANEGKLRRENNQQRAVRVTDEEIQEIYNQMTDAQKEWMEGIVSYLSNDMSRLGNEASMRMYGIEKYKESYYFPMKVWDGVKSARSDKGITGVTENRATSRSWSKRRMHMAQNALVIGNFTQDAISHIVEMINYNTMGPAIENINKVLNFQFTEGETEEDFTKRNLRIMFQENYGREALKYLEDFMKDLNGGVTQDQRKTLQDITLSLFKKNAVAGSLSVAAQQPLSYIRAAMMISPKYLAQALSPAYWKGSYQEMVTHSGVAVIKDMGRFDMNFGQSAKDYITPNVKQSRGRAALNWISDRSTELPEKMDRMTWTRMWSAVKAEQAAKNPMMDIKSEAFLNMVADRFNQLMRETQVYDSILVKSSNMRSQKMGLKVITSFMAEPTLSLNVLANAIQNTDLPGGKTKVAKAGATFLLSAILQAVVKGLMASGRTPDDKKTWLENFLNKLQYNLQNEANPISLIPGYSRIIELLKTGELQDDAMGAIGKLYTMISTARDAVSGNGRGWYRDLEDTVGQFAQMFTNVPAKNLMRDVRAIRNWIAGDTYAARPTSAAVLKYQAEANLYNGDNLLGTVNAWLGDAGFRTTNKAYYQRIYNAIRKGDEAAAGEMKEYLMLGKGAKEETISSGLNQIAKKDESTSAEEKIDLVGQNSTDKATGDYVTKLLKDGEITAAQARKKLKELYQDKTDDDIWWQVDRIEYKKETGDDSVSGYYYRLTDAVNANKAEKITAAVKDLLAHGVTKDKIKSKLSDWKGLYLEADSAGKVKIRDAITKAYKAAGYTKADADKTITNWTKSKSKKK